MGKTNCPIQGGKIEEEKECLGFRIKDEIGKQGGFKVLTGNNERVLHFKALDSFPCVPVSVHEAFKEKIRIYIWKRIMITEDAIANDGVVLAECGAEPDYEYYKCEIEKGNAIVAELRNALRELGLNLKDVVE